MGSVVRRAARTACVAGLALMLLVLPACRAGIPSFGPPAPAKPDFADPGEFTFEVGDTVEVRVWQEAELQTEQVVLPDGTISPPLLDPIPIAGRSISQVRAVLSQAYAKYVNDPQVSVRVVDVQALRIVVLGEVNRAGVYPINGRMRLMQAIGHAGGFNENMADRNTIRVVRARENCPPVVYTANVNQALAGCVQDVFLAPGDVVYVHPTSLANWSRKMIQALAPFNSILSLSGFAGTYATLSNL